MTLVTRLSLFFLTALALVLVGTSISIFLLVRSQLMHELGERFDETFETLSRVAEFGPDGVQWDPTDRRLDFGHDPAGDTAAWQIVQPSGHDVGISDADFKPLFATLPSPGAEETVQQDLPWHGATWRVVRESLTSDMIHAAKGGQSSDNAADKFSSAPPILIVSVAIPISSALAPLRTLGVILAGISTSVWLASAFAGKWLCRKAIAPVNQMAQSARSISAADFSQRLPSPATHDELDELSRAFNDLLDRLQISFQRQQRFTAEASHQLRTPLAAILGQIDVALRRDRSAEEYHRALQSVQRQAEQLKQIIEMLLFLAREESEAAPPLLERLDLREWISSQVAAWAPHPRFADLSLECEGSEPMWIAAHSGLLAQGIHNLLDNAFRYSQPGTPVIVRLRAHDHEIRLSIEDRGQGIESDDLPRVFQPFFRSAAARRRGISGTGLGLAIAQRIAHAMQGKLDVQSQPEQGTSFTMRFRRAPVVANSTDANLAASLVTAEVGHSVDSLAPTTHPHEGSRSI